MRLKRYLRWEFVLAATLVGCTSVAPNRIGLPASTSSSERPGEATGAGKLQSQAVRTSELVFKVRWPQAAGYATQLIPTDTQSLAITVLAKDKTVIGDPAVIQREAGKNTATASIAIPTSYGLVDVQVQAKDGAGKVVAAGLSRDVVLRDNTATGVIVELSEVVDEIKIRQNQQIVLLKNLKTYFERYQDKINYFDPYRSPEWQAALGALGVATQNRMEAFAWLPLVGVPYSPTAPRTVPVSSSTALERLVKLDDPKTFYEIVGTDLKKYAWPLGWATWDFARDGNRHTVNVHADATFPGGSSYTTTADFTTEVTADTWTPEPYFVQALHGLINGKEATRSLVFLGGERPDYNTASYARTKLVLDSKTDVARHFDAEGFVDQFKSISGTDLDQVFRDIAGVNSPTEFRLPRHGRAIANAPSLAATADLHVDDALNNAALDMALRANDTFDMPGNFKLVISAVPTYGTLGGKRAITAAHLIYTLDDLNEKIRLKGTADVTFGFGLTPAFRAKADILDLLAETDYVLGTLTYEMPYLNGVPDANRWAYWPLLELNDHTDPALRTKIRVTPGLFSGESTGSLNLDVR